MRRCQPPLPAASSIPAARAWSTGRASPSPSSRAGRRGWVRRRSFLVTTPSLERSGLAGEVAGWLGTACAGTFAGSREHTPGARGDRRRRCRPSGRRRLPGEPGRQLGGRPHQGRGAAAGRRRRPGRPRAVRAGVRRPGLRAPKVPHVAVPTTLSGAEFTAVAGITDPAVGREADLPRLAAPPALGGARQRPRPGHLPAALWAGTGMKVVADTIEVLCARRANPLSDALALGALPPPGRATSVRPRPTPADVAARGRCQFAVAMVLPQLAAVGVGLVAALRHQLGGGLGVPHGEASTIVLPHVMRYNLPTAAEQYGQGGGGARARRHPRRSSTRIESLTAELGLPTCLQRHRHRPRRPRRCRRRARAQRRRIASQHRPRRRRRHPAAPRRGVVAVAAHLPRPARVL